MGSSLESAVGHQRIMYSVLLEAPSPDQGD
jgi:hypothetical protein